MAAVLKFVSKLNAAHVQKRSHAFNDIQQTFETFLSLTGISCSFCRDLVQIQMFKENSFLFISRRPFYRKMYFVDRTALVWLITNRCVLPLNQVFKILYLIGPDGRVNRRFIDFQKMVWMTTVHVLRFKMKHQKSSEIAGCI